MICASHNLAAMLLLAGSALAPDAVAAIALANASLAAGFGMIRCVLALNPFVPVL